VSDLALALELADVADARSLPRFRALDLAVHTKPDLTPVTDADRAVEEALREHLEVERPGDAVLGEEYGSSGDGPRRWIVDPIDGTKNFSRGLPIWATLIALEDNGTLNLGVVSAPALGRRWWAARGEGAFANGERMRVSRIARLEEAAVSADYAAPLPGVWHGRALGDFWQHMLVAEGALDAAVDPGLSLWDLAALVPIVEEAGGRITSLDGGDPVAGGSAVSTNTVLHEAVLAALR
jgi:histidinol-phosphatase